MDKYPNLYVEFSAHSGIRIEIDFPPYGSICIGRSQTLRNTTGP
jgi:hypothetical protein